MYAREHRVPLGHYLEQGLSKIRRELDDGCLPIGIVHSKVARAVGNARRLPVALCGRLICLSAGDRLRDRLAFSERGSLD
jgi:hypothetical protein